MKDQFSKRETGFLQRLAAFMLAAFMLIGFFPTNASALSQDIKVHQAEGDFIELLSGLSISLSEENYVYFGVEYSAQYTVSGSNGQGNAYGQTVTHKYTGDNYAVGAVLYGNIGGIWQQISWISSDLGGNDLRYDGYYHDVGNFHMYFPKTYDYPSYKLVIGMADLSTEANGMPFTEIYATNTYVFKMGQRIDEGESGASEVEEKTVSLDLYQPFFWEGLSSVSLQEYMTMDFDYAITGDGVLFIPTASGSGTYRLTDSSGKRYILNYTISNNIYSGAVVDEGTRNMKYGDTDVFVTDITGMTRFESANYLNSELDCDPSYNILRSVNGSEAEYQAVGIGSTKLIRTFYSGSSETGYNVHICRHNIIVSNEGVMNVELSPSTMYLRTGDTYQLNVKKTFPDNADDITLGTSYSLTSYSPSIATVDDSGLVTAVSKGYTNIVCTTTQGISDRAYVYVDYDADTHIYFSRLIELDKGDSYFTSYNHANYDLVAILGEKNYAPNTATISSSDGILINALNNGLSTITRIWGLNYKSDDDTYYAPGVYTMKEQWEYIVKVGSTSSDSEDDDDTDVPDNPGHSRETPTYIRPEISIDPDTDTDGINDVKIRNDTDLDIAYYKIDTGKLDGSIQIRITQTREASMRASGLIFDYAQSVGAENYAYYPVNIDLYNTDTKETIHALPDDAKITFYITVPNEMLPLKNRLKVFHINSDNEMEMLSTRITKKGGKTCVRFEMTEFSPVALYVDDLTDEQFEEISAASGYVTSKDEVVYVDYVGSGAGLSNKGFFAMDRSEQTVVFISAVVMLSAVILVSAAAAKKSRKK